jgi:signal transduction histidine kinase
MMHIFDTISMYSALGAAVINAAFIVLILARTSRKPFYLLFLYLCFAVCVWNFGIFLMFYSGRAVWFYFAVIGSPMLPALLFHMTSVLLKTDRGNAWIPLVYLLSGVLSACSLLAVYSPEIKAFVDSVYRYLYYLGLLLPFIVVSMYKMLKAIAITTGAERSQIRYLLVATVIGTLLGITDLVKVFGSPVPKLGQAGSVIFSSVLVVGIFKNRKALDVLAEMQYKFEFLSEMAAGIAHEIRNPLSSIKGAVNLLAAPEAGPSSPRDREYIGIIREEVARLDGILLDFQHLTKPVVIRKEAISINDVLCKTVRLAQLGGLSLNVSMELDDRLPAVQADAAAMKQVFLNLVKNAAEACAGAGELVIRTGRDQRGVIITFRDSGEGIPQAVLRNIFEPFVTTKRSGMGMGLAISRRIVEAHDGRIEARNEEPVGAAISITLPTT